MLHTHITLLYGILAAMSADPWDTLTDSTATPTVAPVSAAPISAARALADAGLTLAEIANELGMSEAQVARLPELADATIGEPHLNRVEQSLYAVAVGGLVQRTVVTGERGQTVTDRQLPPDPKAAQAWLQARRPAQWGALAQGIQAAVTINLIGVDRAKHVKVARVIEHEAPAGGPIETPGVGDPRIEIGGGSVLEDPSTPDIPLLDLTTSKKISG